MMNLNGTKTMTVNGKEVMVCAKLSDRYKPVLTSDVISYFENRGWKVKSRMGSSETISKHSVDLLNPDYVYPNGDGLSIKIINSYDGSSRLSIYGGYFRLVCSNGLVLGEYSGLRVRHVGNVYEQLEESYDRIVAYMDNIKLVTDKMKNKIITDTNKVITDVVKEIVEEDGLTYKTELVEVNQFVLKQLNKKRRVEDVSEDAFTLLNRVQENIIRKGMLSAKVRVTNKKTGEVIYKEVGKNKCETKISSLNLNLKISSVFTRLVA